MKLTEKQYKELKAANDEQLQEKLIKSNRFLDSSVWKYGSAVNIVGPRHSENGLLIFIPYEFKRDFSL